MDKKDGNYVNGCNECEWESVLDIHARPKPEINTLDVEPILFIAFLKFH